MSLLVLKVYLQACGTCTHSSTYLHYYRCGVNWADMRSSVYRSENTSFVGTHFFPRHHHHASFRPMLISPSRFHMKHNFYELEERSSSTSQTSRREHARVLSYSCSEGSSVFDCSSLELLTQFITLQHSSAVLLLRNRFRDYASPLLRSDRNTESSWNSQSWTHGCNADSDTCFLASYLDSLCRSASL